MKKKKLREKTENEKLVAKVIRSKRLPFVFSGGKKHLSNQSFDFIAKDGSKKTIEVENPERSHRDVVTRTKLFYKHGWKVVFLDNSVFVRYNSKDMIASILENF